ncbi:MAG: tetratricopeptide repeat protein [Polyangia bacterium]
MNKAPSSRAYVNYGLTFMRRGQYNEALKYYRLALELAPNWHIIHINLGIAYQQLGNWDQARYHFDRAVQTEQYSAQALSGRWWIRQNIGDLAARLGQKALADQSFAEAQRLKEDGK